MTLKTNLDSCKTWRSGRDSNPR
ncbi:MAG: hypothetical protein RLZZ373_1060, partial [Pseudomonadota bacterium]